MSSHVMTYLRLVLRLLPDVPVALRLGDVVPRHDLPPSRLEAASLMPAAFMSFPGLPTRATSLL
jgi:hypothetical protein